MIKNKDFTADEKIIKYSGILALALFFISIIAGIAPLLLHFKTNRLTAFYVLAPILAPIFFLPLAFPIVSFFQSKNISTNKTAKIFCLSGNIGFSVFCIYMITVSIMGR